MLVTYQILNSWIFICCFCVYVCGLVLFLDVVFVLHLITGGQETIIFTTVEFIVRRPGF